MMLMLAEPTIYLLIAIADYAEIKDYVLYNEEEDDPDTMIPEDDVTPVDMDGDGEPDTEISTKPVIKPDSLSKSLLSRVDTELESKVAITVTPNIAIQNIWEGPNLRATLANTGVKRIKIIIPITPPIKELMKQ